MTPCELFVRPQYLRRIHRFTIFDRAVHLGGRAREALRHAPKSVQRRVKIFSSMTLTAMINGDQVASSTVSAPNINSSTLFNFAPPVEILAGNGELTFALSALIAGGKAVGLDLPASIELAGVSGGGRPSGGGTSDLLFALSLFGFVMAPLTSTRQRRRVSIPAAAMLVLATVAVGCGSSSGGGPAPASSDQQIVALNVTENGNQVPALGLPIDLGKIRER